MASLPQHSAYQVVFGNRDEWHLDGDRPRRFISARAREFFFAMTSHEPGTRLCPFCRSYTLSCGVSEADHELYREGDSDLIGFGLEVCPRCACWRFWSANYQCMDDPLYVVAASVAARFDPELPASCNDELARALRQRPHLWHSATPAGLERFVAEIIRANHGPCEVRHVGGTADGGIDVLLIRTDGDHVPIQVKRRASLAKREPVTTIRELLGTMVIHGARTGMVVSTAVGFTAPAVNEAAVARDRGFFVELVDRWALDEMLGPLVSRRPWTELFARPELQEAVALLKPVVEGTLYPDQLHLPIR